MMEAQAAGVPVVATAVGGTPELVQHERTGLLVPPRDVTALSNAILRLFQGSAISHVVLQSFWRRLREYRLPNLSVDRMVDTTVAMVPKKKPKRGGRVAA